MISIKSSNNNFLEGKNTKRMGIYLLTIVGIYKVTVLIRTEY